MPPLAKHTRLRLAEGLRVEVRGASVSVEAGGDPLELPRGVLPLLAFFETPRMVAEGWAFLGDAARGSQGLADAFGRILQLAEAGVLVREDGSTAAGGPSRVDLGEGAFGPASQIRMLDDRVRTACYLAAIRATVRPDDTVVDLGTGSGVLAVAAAHAGAEHVYAIEAQPIADAAQRLFDASGFGGRITLLRGLSTGLALPEKADVLVSEILGHDPFAERLLESTRDAVARFLKPGARLVPARLRVFLTPVEVPEAVRRRAFFTPAALARWQRAHGLPLAGLDETTVVPSALRRVHQEPWPARAWKALAKPAPLWDLDLARADAPAPVDFAIRLTRAGALGGLLLHFEVQLAPGLALSTAPAEVQRSNHWKCPLWLWVVPRPVKRGEELRLRAEVRGGRVELAITEAER